MAGTTKRKKREGFVTLTTRVKHTMLLKLRNELAPRYGGTLTAMYEAVLINFFRERPWVLRDNFWMKTQALSMRNEEKQERRQPDGRPLAVPVFWQQATGWVQVNMLVKEDLAEKVRMLAATEGVSSSSVLLTALVWWVVKDDRLQRAAKNFQEKP